MPTFVLLLLCNSSNAKAGLVSYSVVGYIRNSVLVITHVRTYICTYVHTYMVLLVCMFVTSDCMSCGL